MFPASGHILKILLLLIAGHSNYIFEISFTVLSTWNRQHWSSWLAVSLPTYWEIERLCSALIPLQWFRPLPFFIL